MSVTCVYCIPEIRLHCPLFHCHFRHVCRVNGFAVLLLVFNSVVQFIIPNSSGCVKSLCLGTLVLWCHMVKKGNTVFKEI